ncbi:hypothetical protein [uncultured Cohaesibacter sp.]|uniref:hypothetical protein n=1 Tax=uncultured Cohaesibacter sp. TaxID=1002546 RepID=UPI0029C78637|nr:hypothetical protein [uncultured Cohaesibacter sp.]
MTKIRLALLAAVASSVIGGGYAHAAGSNNAAITQNGDDNIAKIDQSGGAGNQFNSTGAADTSSALQDGDDNTITATQSGNNNEIGLAGAGVDQIGDSNVFTATQSSNGNVVGSVQQDSSDYWWFGWYRGENEATVTQQGGSNNTIDLISQTATGNKNIATLTQNGSDNYINSVIQENTGSDDNSIDASIEGNNNGVAGFTSGSFAAASGADDSSLKQYGSDNEIDLDINGNFNQFGVYQDSNILGLAIGKNTLSALDINGSYNELGVKQIGTNTLNLSSINGDRNDIGVYQAGAGNNATINLGATSNDNKVGLTQNLDNDADINIHSGDGNSIEAAQYGLNALDVDITGAGNEFVISQDGPLGVGTNDLTLTVYGSYNGATGAFTSGGAADIGLTAGSLVQNGTLNSASWSIGLSDPDSNNNLIAMAQVGSFNDITATIDGDSNEVAISQSGNFNTSVVTQSGTSNVVGITQ